MHPTTGSQHNLQQQIRQIAFIANIKRPGNSSGVAQADPPDGSRHSASMQAELRKRPGNTSGPVLRFAQDPPDGSPYSASMQAELRKRPGNSIGAGIAARTTHRMARPIPLQCKRSCASDPVTQAEPRKQTHRMTRAIPLPLRTSRRTVRSRTRTSQKQPLCVSVPLCFKIHPQSFQKTGPQKRRTRDSNPQPLTGHIISNDAASHSLILQWHSVSRKHILDAVIHKPI